MIALYILSFLLVLFVLLCFVKLKFTALYNDTLTLKLSFLFLNFNLLPKKEKKKKAPKKKKEKIPKKKKETKNKKKKKPSALKKLMDKKGLEGLISIVKDVSKLAYTTLKGLFEKVVIEKLSIDITVVGDDAADTALKYGKLCSVFYSCVHVICSTAVCEHYDLNVTPDFDDEAKQKIYADAKFYVRTFYVLKYALNALFKMLVIRYKR